MICENWEMWWLMTSVCCPSQRWNHCCTKLRVTIFCFCLFINTAYKKQTVIYTSAEEGLLWHMVFGIPTSQSKLETVRSHVHGKYMYTEQNRKLRVKLLGWGRLVTRLAENLLSGFKARSSETGPNKTLPKTSACSWLIIMIIIIIIITMTDVPTGLVEYQLL